MSLTSISRARSTAYCINSQTDAQIEMGWCRWTPAGLHWLSITGRTQRVKVGNSFSEPKPVTNGVPQGSVIGPMLFIFYINDIANEISPVSIHKLYADDLKAYNAGVNDKKG